jgi:hypothetical protein
VCVDVSVCVDASLFLGYVLKSSFSTEPVPVVDIIQSFLSIDRIMQMSSSVTKSVFIFTRFFVIVVCKSEIRNVQMSKFRVKKKKLFD